MQRKINYQDVLRPTVYHKDSISIYEQSEINIHKKYYED